MDWLIPIASEFQYSDGKHRGYIKFSNNSGSFISFPCTVDKPNKLQIKRLQKQIKQLPATNEQQRPKTRKLPQRQPVKIKDTRLRRAFEKLYRLHYGSNVPGYSVLIVFDNQEEFCFKLAEYVRTRFPYFSYDTNIESTKKFDYLFYFSFQPTNRIMLKGQTLKKMRPKAAHAVLFNVRNGKNIKETIIETGDIDGFRKNDFGIHVAFMEKVFQKTDNNVIVWTALLNYLPPRPKITHRKTGITKRDMIDRVMSEKI